MNRMSLIGTNGLSLTNNIIYNTYRSAIVVTGTNNIIRNNLVSTVYWLGTGQIPSVAEFNFNNDGAIMTSNVNSVRLVVCFFRRMLKDLYFVVHMK